MSDQTKGNCTAINGEDNYAEIRQGVRAVCAEFGNPYFRKVTYERRYPEEFVTALTKARWLSALIPNEYGGLGLGLAEASVIMEEINRSGGNSGNCHAQMYNMGTVYRFNLLAHFCIDRVLLLGDCRHYGADRQAYEG